MISGKQNVFVWCIRNIGNRRDTALEGALHAPWKTSRTRGGIAPSLAESDRLHVMAMRVFRHMVESVAGCSRSVAVIA